MTRRYTVRLYIVISLPPCERKKSKRGVETDPRNATASRRPAGTGDNPQARVYDGEEKRVAKLEA